MRIHTKQGTEGTLMLLKHIRAETKLGEMMESSEAWHRVWAGTGEGFLENPKSPIPPMTRGWLINIREFLEQCDAKIENGRSEKQIRQRDFFIMERLLKMEWTPSQMEQLNRCHLHLQVSGPSDISSADGKYLRKNRSRIHAGR